MNKEKFLHDIEMVDSIDFGNDKFVTFFGSARFDDENFFVKEAEKLAYKLAKAGFAIITGGGESVMKAANKGANLAGRRNLGFNIVLPHEQHSNEFIDESFDIRASQICSYGERFFCNFSWRFRDYG